MTLRHVCYFVRKYATNNEPKSYGEEHLDNLFSFYRFTIQVVRHCYMEAVEQSRHHVVMCGRGLEVGSTNEFIDPLPSLY